MGYEIGKQYIRDAGVGDVRIRDHGGWEAVKHVSKDCLIYKADNPNILRVVGGKEYYIVQWDGWLCPAEKDNRYLITVLSGPYPTLRPAMAVMRLEEV